MHESQRSRKQQQKATDIQKHVCVPHTQALQFLWLQQLKSSPIQPTFPPKIEKLKEYVGINNTLVLTEQYKKRKTEI